MTINRISILGAGSFGTALAKVVAQRAGSVLLWGRNEQLINDINMSRQNSAYLPGCILPANVTATFDIKQAIDADLVMVAVPSQQFRSLCEQISNVRVPLIICCKGIEENSLMLMSEIAEQIIANVKIAILSGPNFAFEMAQNKPVGATIAAADIELAKTITIGLSTNFFRLYASNDIIGAQINGVTKNIIAIACGIAMGLDMGESAKAAVITRGVAEIKRLLLTKGGKIESLLGFAGIGDIFLTCNSLNSRNTLLGHNLAKGDKLADILANKTIEGYSATKSVYELAKKLKITMPITEAMHAIMYHQADINQVVYELSSRPLADE